MRNITSPSTVCSEQSELDASMNGTVISPGYDDEYGNNLLCKLTIEAEEGYVVFVEFETFEFEGDEPDCESDYLEVGIILCRAYS